MAGGAGKAIRVELAIHLRLLRHGSRQHADRIVSTVAVACELNAFCSRQDVYTGTVERRAEGVRVQGLTPLGVRLLVAVSTIRSLGKSPGLYEIVALNGRVAWCGEFVVAEVEVIALA